MNDMVSNAASAVLYLSAFCVAVVVVGAMLNLWAGIVFRAYFREKQVYLINSLKIPKTGGSNEQS